MYTCDTNTRDPFSLTHDWPYEISFWITLYLLVISSIKEVYGETYSPGRKKISHDLSDKFVLVIDGWTHGSTHFIGLFASYKDNNKNGYHTALLGLSPMMSETFFTAADHIELIQYVLNVFNKSLTNVVVIIGDDAEVNKSRANLWGIPLIGCASHKFQLAVSCYLGRNESFLNKINTLMGKLKSLKLSGKLREHTPLQPIQRNKTFWSSTYDMINRYIELKPFLDFFQEEPNLIDNLLTPRENNDLQTLQDDLKNLFSVTCALQRENLDLYDVRVL